MARRNDCVIANAFEEMANVMSQNTQAFQGAQNDGAHHGRADEFRGLGNFQKN